MSKWVCKVCGYVHEGPNPPAICPVCGVGPEEFSELEPSAKAVPPKRWKCIVCDYVHSGDEPPDICPVCGVGKDKFILLIDEIKELTPAAIAEAGDGTVNSALDAVTYGLYIVASVMDGKINGQTANAVFQLTAVPPQIAVCINKRNLTHEYLTASNRLTISILSQDQGDIVRKFGYQSGRNVDKFADVKYILGKNGCPILADCLGYLEATVLPDKIIDVGTHTMFVAQITSGRRVAARKALTYHFYRESK
jgi:flavin reductase (DIM6/NTAB) family NADH-FMN oxidoreductase RutF/rubredoxin